MSESLANLTAAILVGGLGTRLRTAVPDQQKVLAPVGGRPFLTRILDQLDSAGLRHVVLCTGYKADQVAEVVGDQYRNLRISYSPEPSPFGTAGALLRMRRLSVSDSILAMNGDSFCSVDLAAFYLAHCSHRAQASLVVTQVADTVECGRVTFDEQHWLTSFIEKGGACTPGWINAGIYLLGRPILESIPADCRVSIELETFPAWIGRGLFAFPTTEKFLDIGTPAAYSKAQEIFYDCQ